MPPGAESAGAVRSPWWIVGLSDSSRSRRAQCLPPSALGFFPFRVVEEPAGGDQAHQALGSPRAVARSDAHTEWRLDRTRDARTDLRTRPRVAAEAHRVNASGRPLGRRRKPRHRRQRERRGDSAHGVASRERARRRRRGGIAVETSGDSEESASSSTTAAIRARRARAKPPCTSSSSPACDERIATRARAPPPASSSTRRAVRRRDEG